MKVFVCALAFLMLFVGGAFCGFEQIALNPAEYDRLQDRLDVYESVGLTREAQSRVNAVLTGYLSGARDDIDTEEELWGVRGQVFNADEKAHMVDVANLFHLERTIRTVCLAAGGALLLATAWLLRGQLIRTSLRALGLAVLILLALVGLILLTYALCGFDRLFLLFHQLLFTNDLWLMNPATDAMIRMFPADFFQQIALRCGANALALGVFFPAAAQLLLAAAALIQKHSGRKQTP